MEQKIIEIVADQFDKEFEELSLTTDFRKDLDADSLDVVQIIMEIETEFEVEVEETQVEKLTDIKSVVEYIKTLK
ncbi:MAG: acyl carrier protein [Tissierellales bacterium]|jgi:acyl carrier protein|nr:acyl carrier protein [Tissierellales bacterium]